MNQGDQRDELESNREPMTPSTGPFPDVAVDPLFERIVPEHDPYGVLRNPDYRRFLLSGMVATGTSVTPAPVAIAVGASLSPATTAGASSGNIGTLPLSVTIQKPAAKGAIVRREAEAKALHRAEIRLANRGHRLNIDQHRELGYSTGKELKRL